MRLLVVEDETRIVELLQVALRRAGFVVDAFATASAGREALSFIAYDAAVLDLGLPDGDGLELLASMRRGGSTVPVLILTARDAVEDRVAGLDAGADDYLVKPFALSELAARIRALARRQSGRNPLLVITDLSINTVTREAHRNDQLLELSAKEYAILEYLARNPGRLITRANLEEHIWNEELQPNSNIVDVYIARIRRKLDDGHELKLLETVRGAGYRLRAPSEAKLCVRSAPSAPASPPGTPWPC